MVISALINILVAPIKALFSVLPHGVLFDVTKIDNGADQLGGFLGFINRVFPVTDILAMLVLTYVVIIPFVVVYKIFEWVYSHLPEILGFGPGPG